mgnify:CR=1 FL=1
MTYNSDDTLHLTGVFDNIEDTFIKPGLVFKLDTFFIDHWLPLLGPNRAWLVVTLQQALWRGSIPGLSADISQADLADQAGLSRKRVNELLNHDPLLRWFVPTIKQQVKSGKQQNNRYQVRLSSPPTPALAAGLRREIETRLSGGEDLPAIVSALTGEAETAREALLARLNDAAAGKAEPSQGITDIVQACAGGELDDPLRLAVPGLRRALLRPHQARLETHYFRRNWLPLLGSTAAWVVVVLRRDCYADENEVRDEVSLGKQVLAAKLGVSSATMKRLLKNEYLPRFFQMWQPDRYTLTGRIKMHDPLTPADTVKAGELQQQQTDFFEITPEQPKGNPAEVEPEKMLHGDNPNRKKCDTAETGNGQNVTRPEAERSKCDTVETGNGQNVTRLNGQNVTRPEAERSKCYTAEARNGQNVTRLNGQNVTRPEAERSKCYTAEAGNGQNVTAIQHFKDSALFKDSDQESLKAGAAVKTHGHAYEPAAAAAQPEPPDPYLLNLYRQEIGPAKNIIQNQIRAAAAEIPDRDLWERAFAEMAAANKAEWRYVLAIARRMQRDAAAANFATNDVTLPPNGDSPATGDITPPHPAQSPAAPPPSLSLTEALWQDTLSQLRLQMSRQTFDAWLKGTALRTAGESVWTVECANSYARDWLENRLRTTMERAAGSVAGGKVTLNFVTQEQEA